MNIAQIISEQYLENIKSKYQEIISENIKRYYFEGKNNNIFENLVIFEDNEILNKITKDHYLSVLIDNEQRIWNKYFWNLRYIEELKKLAKNNAGHDQKLFQILEELSNYEQFDRIEDFASFAVNFENQEYIKFDYFSPCYDNDSMSSAIELNNILKILDIETKNLVLVDELIWKNVDNNKAELITFYNPNNVNEFVSIDTFSAGEDQINPVDIFIQCSKSKEKEVDKELVKWCDRNWSYSGPSVNIVNLNKFDYEKHFENRKRISMN